MCLHINLKYDRTDTRTHTFGGGGDYEQDHRIYICEICKNEFEMIKS